MHRTYSVSLPCSVKSWSHSKPLGWEQCSSEGLHGERIRVSCTACCHCHTAAPKEHLHGQCTLTGDARTSPRTAGELPVRSCRFFSPRRKRRQEPSSPPFYVTNAWAVTSCPTWCSAPPVLFSPSPAAGTVAVCRDRSPPAPRAPKLPSPPSSSSSEFMQGKYTASASKEAERLLRLCDRCMLRPPAAVCRPILAERHPPLARYKKRGVLAAGGRRRGRAG